MTNFSAILIKIHTFSFKKMQLKMSSGNWRPFCLSLNVLRQTAQYKAEIWGLNIEAETVWPLFGQWYIQMYFLQWRFLYFILIWLKFVLRSHIDNMPASALIMAWCQNRRQCIIILLGGYIGFTPSVRPSRVRPASRVRSVASTVLVGSISYLCIL